MSRGETLALDEAADVRLDLAGAVGAERTRAR
jgi:hypothetical protein